MADAMPCLKACLFDMDGTLIDSERIWIAAIRHALSLKGICVSVNTVAEMEYGHAWTEIFADIQRRWPGAFSCIQEMEAITAPFYDDATAREDISIAASVSMLRRLSAAGFRIAIVSGSLKSRIAGVVSQLRLENMVEFAVGSGDYLHGKPEPDSYIAAYRLLGLAPEECLVFEDAPAGVEAAKRAGMACIALKRPVPFPADLSMADRIVQSMDELGDAQAVAEWFIKLKKTQHKTIKR